MENTNSVSDIRHPNFQEDVAEVLHRRFFKPYSIRDRESFRPHVVAALKGITDLDEQTRKDGKAAEERLLKSYPFHPDLTDVFHKVDQFGGLSAYARCVEDLCLGPARSGTVGPLPAGRGKKRLRFLHRLNHPPSTSSV